MARIRSLKPSIWSDQRFIQLSLPARLLCVGMISNADDDGRIIASGVALLGAVFPHDDLPPRKVEAWRDEIAETGLITVYRVGRALYACFPRWTTHQRIQKRQPSPLPAPPDSGSEPRNEYATQSYTESATPYENRSYTDSATDTEGETETDRERDAAAAAHAAALDLLDAADIRLADVRRKVGPVLEEAVLAGVDSTTVKVALVAWRGRGGKPGLLPLLIEEYHGKATTPTSVTTLPPLCGHCVDRLVELIDGTWQRCPECHPKAVRAAS